jgi:hypothetical protein
MAHRLTLKEAAERAGQKDVKAFRRNCMCKPGFPPVIKVSPRIWLIDEADFEAWMDSCKVRA